MTDFRNPVETSKMKQRLACKDFDEAGNPNGITECQRWRDSKTPGDTTATQCPNRCEMGGFLFPRYKRADNTIHYHQGIDLTPANARTGPQSPKTAQWREANGVRIRAVAGGRVVFPKKGDKTAINDAPHTGGTTYGNYVVIHDEKRNLYFLYGHCHRLLVKTDDEVLEGQEIAIVGRTGIRTDSIRDHLHFEVSQQKLPLGSGAKYETQLGGPESPRLDPLRILAELGPWGIQQTYLPNGAPVDGKELRSALQAISGQTEGQFPLGSNNLWHGGLHLPPPGDGILRAPFDGEIMAFRLDPDADRANNQAFGSTNFILMRHKLEPSVARHLRGEKAAASSSPAPVRAVGPRHKGCENRPEDVRIVREDLERHNYLSAESGNGEKALVDAIRRFQSAVLGHKAPDGVVEYGRDTWEALREGAPANEEASEDDGDEQEASADDESLILYSLYMHVGARSMDENTAKDFAWLLEVRLTNEEAVSPEPTAPPPQEDADLAYTLRGQTIGPATLVDESVDPEDVRWIQRRLLARYPELYRGEVSGVYDDATLAAVRNLQNQHHASHRKRQDGPGYVKRGGGTEKLLRGPASSGKGGSTRAPKKTLDPALVERVSSTDERGQSPVVRDIAVPIAGSKPLWAVSNGTRFHWELFSAEPLMGDAWPKLEDDDETIAAPKKLIDMAQEYDDGILFRKDDIVSDLELQAFYARDVAASLRTTQVLFRSEWGWDVAEVARHLEALGFDTTDYESHVAPYQWWADVFGDHDAKVWHYHPLEFMGAYQAVLDRMREVQAAPVVDTSQLGRLEVRVLSKDDKPLLDIGVTAHAADQSTPHATTGEDGIAVFPAVHGGPCLVTVDGSETEGSVTLLPEETAELVLRTELDVPRGRLRVRAMTGPGGKKLRRIPIVVRPRDSGPPLEGETNWDGYIDFEDVPQGTYDVRDGRTEPTLSPGEVLVKAGKKPDTATLYERVTLRVKVAHDGHPRDGVLVSILDAQGLAVGVQTTASTKLLKGAAEFSLDGGEYTILAGDAKPLKHTLGKIPRTSVLRKLQAPLGTKADPKKDEGLSPNASAPPER